MGASHAWGSQAIFLVPPPCLAFLWGPLFVSTEMTMEEPPETLSFSGWHLGSSSPTRDQTCTPCNGSTVLTTAPPENSLQRLLKSSAQGTDTDKLGDSCSPDLLASHQTVTNKNIMDSIWLPLVDFFFLKKRSRCFTQQERILKVVCRWNEICIAALKGHLYGNIHTLTFHQIYLKYLFYLFIWLYWVLVVACGLWFPDQGSNPGPWHWERRVLTTRPPGKPPQPALKAYFPFTDTSGILLGDGHILSMILLKSLVHHIMTGIILHFLLFTSSIFLL